MRQWRAVKARHPDELLFFQVGDFYELFERDAEEGARLLGITLTARNNGAAGKVPLAGVPAHAIRRYLGKVIRMGRRAVICEQIEDAGGPGGIARREVVETVTPGTVLAEDFLEARRNNFIACLLALGDSIGVAAMDVSTGELVLAQTDQEGLEDVLALFRPSELLAPESETGRAPGRLKGVPRTRRPDWSFSAGAAAEELSRSYGVLFLDGLGLGEADDLRTRAAGALLAYVREVRPEASALLRPPRILQSGTHMTLDRMTRENLELERPLRREDKGASLLDALDLTRTAMGARLMRRWLSSPLLAPDRIERRLDAVEELVGNAAMRAELRRVLGRVQDLERLSTLAGSRRIGPRQLLGLGLSLHAAAKLCEAAAAAESQLLAGLANATRESEKAVELILGGIREDTPRALADGGVIRSAHSAELARERAAVEEAEAAIGRLEAEERAKTGIANLRIGWNRVFGYYLEVSRKKSRLAPSRYIRKQSLTNVERYATTELAKLQEAVYLARERVRELEVGLFSRLVRRVADKAPEVQKAARRIARLDALASLAEAASRHDYCRPDVRDDGPLELIASRHPVVERFSGEESFIPNDLRMDDESRVIVLTGPNMAGKSTLLRQVGLCQIMAQVGSFVPARSARLPVRDRVYTRVGASDSLSRGLSTFMVEMTETAAILNGATSKSLVLLDEIGRGTSTFDGVSIAWAVTERLHDQVGARTIFATHYHELVELADALPAARNLNVGLEEGHDGIVFIRKLREGGADRSYGIHVAQIAGLPKAVVARAREHLKRLESGATPAVPQRTEDASPAPPPGNALEEEALVRLRACDPDHMTPKDALREVYRLKALLGAR